MREGRIQGRPPSDGLSHARQHTQQARPTRTLHDGPSHLGANLAKFKGSPPTSILPYKSPLTRPEATDDLILIGMNVFADKDPLGGELACVFRGKGLEIKAAAGEVEHVRERAACQLQE